jgi:pyruvate/2-oxoglutarate/acetoin dehydrogenase E1 component
LPTPTELGLPPSPAFAADLVESLRLALFTPMVEQVFADLHAAPIRITRPHVPLPAADALEDATIPSVVRIVETVRKAMD